MIIAKAYLTQTATDLFRIPGSHEEGPRRSMFQYITHLSSLTDVLANVPLAESNVWNSEWDARFGPDVCRSKGRESSGDPPRHNITLLSDRANNKGTIERQNRAERPWPRLGSTVSVNSIMNLMQNDILPGNT